MHGAVFWWSSPIQQLKHWLKRCFSQTLETSRQEIQRTPKCWRTKSNFDLVLRHVLDVFFQIGPRPLTRLLTVWYMIAKYPYELWRDWAIYEAVNSTDGIRSKTITLNYLKDNYLNSKFINTNTQIKSTTLHYECHVYSFWCVVCVCIQFKSNILWWTASISLTYVF